LEYFCVWLDVIGSRISEIKFMIYVLNILTRDKDLQLALLKKRIGGTINC
jgi:hypothetical protein